MRIIITSPYFNVFGQSIWFKKTEYITHILLMQYNRFLLLKIRKYLNSQEKINYFIIDIIKGCLG